MNNIILMTQENWMCSQLSLARMWGRVRFNGYEYVVVNKDGIDLFTCAMKAQKEGRLMAIEKGEPADLVRYDFVSLYRKLKRDRFIEILNSHCKEKDSDIKKAMKVEISTIKKNIECKKDNQLNLFNE